MAVILHSTWGGIYSGILAQTCRINGIDTALLKSPTPLVLDAFVYGTTVNLTHRFIEQQGKEHFKTFGVLCRIGIIALKILVPYLLTPLLKKGLDIKIPTVFIHLENGIYLLALMDRNNISFRVNMIRYLEKKYCSLFD